MAFSLNLMYDSNPTTSDDSDEDGSGGGGSGDEKKKKKKEKKSKTAKTVSEKPRKQRKKKDKNIDPDKPKRPASGFMLWLNATRETIKAKYPGISITEVSKKGGEMWRELTDKSEWEAKAAAVKAEYEKAMKEYKESGGGGGGGEDAVKSSKGEKSSKPSKSSSPSKATVSPTKRTLILRACCCF